MAYFDGQHWDLGAGLILVRISPENKLEYLLLQMKDREWNWGPPKGYLHRNESDLDGAQRETFEETGLVPQDYQVFEEFSIELRYKARGRPKRVKYFPALMKDSSKQIRLSHEHQDGQWFQLLDACEKAFGRDLKEELLGCDTFLKTKLKL